METFQSNKNQITEKVMIVVKVIYKIILLQLKLKYYILSNDSNTTEKE